MPRRELPARPHPDHLRHEAKALRRAFRRGEAAAVERVRAALGPRSELKLTEAQRVIAREYGFASWAKLRSRVQALRGLDEAVAAFLAAVSAGAATRARDVLGTEPRIATASLQVAAVLGQDADVRRLLAADPSSVRAPAGEPPSEPLLWLCYSPFHGESAERDRGLEASARALLDAGADPNTRDPEHGLPALFAVTGHHHAPRIARLLLEAGASSGAASIRLAKTADERPTRPLPGLPAVRGRYHGSPGHDRHPHARTSRSPRRHGDYPVHCGPAG